MKRVAAKPRAKAAPRKSAGWRRANCAVVVISCSRSCSRSVVGEMLDLTCSRIDVVGDWPFILIAHLATGVVERGRYRIEGAGQTLLLHADLRRRLLASRIDELHGLILRLANDLRSLTAQTGATAVPEPLLRPV